MRWKCKTDALVRILSISAALGAAPGAFAQTRLPVVIPRPGLIITHSVRVKPGTYRLRAPESLDSAVIVIRGDDLVVDLSGVRLVGQPEGADPDHATGVALRVDGGHDVRLAGARVRGYKIGILARGTRRLELADDDASYNWKPRLYSRVEHESLVDWLSFHHNDHDEWLRYGAGIYLADVHGGAIHGSRAEQGMNGLMLVRSDRLRIWSNNFSYDSGLGIGLYRSSYNTIMHNSVDYDVRGYSERFYHRGQDSAALLMYEQSDSNVVAFNSMTHGGDGLFIWAGQSTMDSGTGGVNDNVVYRNDFSFAPANAMEATFSRNALVENRCDGSDYGLWAGYSHDTAVLGNEFAHDNVGVAVEHGQNNTIARNRFDGDSTGVSLWANPVEPSDWGYPKHRDTRSRDYLVDRNSFTGVRVAVRARNTAGLVMGRNRFVAVDSVAVLTDGAHALREEDGRRARDTITAARARSTRLSRYAPPPILARATRPPMSALARRDRSAIVVDEWGPFDYRSPKLWPANSSRGPSVRLQVLGPQGGRWSVARSRGISSLSKSAGTIPDAMTVVPRPDSTGDWSVTLEYRGAALRSPRGVDYETGTPYAFSYSWFEPRIDWSLRFYAWGDSTDPRTHPDAFGRLLAGTPFLVRALPRLDYEWGRPPTKAIPAERFAIDALGRVDLPPGRYLLQTISDDGIRVWIDGALAVDHWAAHESAVDSVAIGGGRHELRVQYYQVDGWVELRLEIARFPRSAAARP